MMHVFMVLLLVFSTSVYGTQGGRSFFADATSSNGNINDDEDEDLDDTGEVDEDIIIDDEEDTNDDEGVTEGSN